MASRERVREVNGDLQLSSAALADAFGVSVQTLGNWARDGCPKARAGWWILSDVLKWKGMHGGRARGGDGEDGLSDSALKTRYEAELKRLQAEQLDLKNAIARGEYIPRDELVPELSRWHTELKLSLRGLARTLATEVGPFVDPATARRIEREIQDLIDGALTRMSNGEAYEPPQGRVIKG